jgi:hypothetical protein
MKKGPSHHRVPQVYLKQWDAGNGIIVYDMSRRPHLHDLIRQVKRDFPHLML